MEISGWHDRGGNNSAQRELNAVKLIFRGSVMKGPGMESARFLNAVALQNAVLCAECDVVSDSPHDICLVCGSRSLFNIARMFGGNLPENRATRIETQIQEHQISKLLLAFPRMHRVRRKA